MVVSLNEFLGLLHLAFVCLLLLVVEQGAAQPELTYDECLGAQMESDTGISITVDCVSTPSFAYLTLSGIDDVHYLAIFYSCRNMSSDELAVKSKDDTSLSDHNQMNYNISVPLNANCSFTICYESQPFYEISLLGTTKTCITPSNSPTSFLMETFSMTVNPTNADVAVGTTITIDCFVVNGTCPTSLSWLTGTDACLMQVKKGEGSGSDTQRETELFFNGTGVKEVICLCKDERTGKVVNATATINVVDSLIPQVPQNLFYTTLSPTSLSVLWKNSQTSNERVVPPIGFRIVLRRIFVKEIVANLFVEFATNKTNYTMELQGLEKFVPYIVEVSAMNKYGYSQNASIYVFSEQGIPKVSPKNITVRRIHDTTIEVKWLPLTLEEARGFITSYTVYYYRTTNGIGIDQHVARRKVVVSAQEQAVIITDLNPLYEYNVEVSASTQCGESSHSPRSFTKGFNLCFTVSSCHHWKIPNDTKTGVITEPFDNFSLINNYLKQTCGVSFSISIPQLTCSYLDCQYQLFIHARITSSNDSGLAHQLTSCVTGKPHVPLTRLGVTINLKNSCTNLISAQRRCYTHESTPSLPLSSTNVQLVSVTSTALIITIVLLALTTLILSTFAVLLTILYRRKVARPQEFAEYIPKINALSYQLTEHNHTTPTSFANVYDHDIVTSCKSYSIENTSLNLKQDQTYRQQSHDSMISVASSSDSNFTEKLETYQCSSLSSTSDKQSSHHVIVL